MSDKSTDWYVYILKCSDDSLYSGVTTDLKRRLSEHNESALGAKYTRARRPVKMVFQQQLNNRSEAQKRETEIKRLSRKQKLNLING